MSPLSTDPIGFVLAYVPVALAIIAMVMAFLPAGTMFVLEAQARRRARRIAPAEPEPTPA